MNPFVAYALSLALVSQAMSPFAFAERDNSGLILLLALGSTTTANNNNKRMNLFIGWGIIFAAAAVRDTSAKTADLNSDRTVITAYTQFDSNGKGLARNEIQSDLPQILESVEMEALLADGQAGSTGAPGALVLDEFAQAKGVGTPEISHLIVNSKAFADGLLRDERFASSKQTVTQDSVAKTFGHILSTDDWEIVTNYLQLRNISIGSTQ